MRKMRLNKLAKGEKGQALIIVVLLMLVSALVIAPMLSHVSSGLRSGREVYEERMYGQYAADSGVEDALYKIQIDDPALPDEWDGAWTDVDAYDTLYRYWLEDINGDNRDINGNNVEVIIQPQFVLDGLEAPPTGMTPHADIMVVGDTIGTVDVSGDVHGLYQISINFTQDMRTVHLNKIGAWLPGGYTYVDDSSNLENDPGVDYVFTVTKTLYRGGTAITWNFLTPHPTFADLPGEGNERTVTFQFEPQGYPSSAFTWVVSDPMDIYLSWDVDLKFYQITSTATDIVTGKTISIDAYAAENELRDLGITVSGDYCAIGATLMTGGPPIRDTLLAESDATVSDIPSSGRVEAAYLYWSAWLVGNALPVFSDDCLDFTNWSAGSRWLCVGTPPGVVRFMGQGGATVGAGTLTMVIPDTVSLDLSAYADYDVVRVVWDQDASDSVDGDEGLYLAFSGDGGSSWSDYIEAFLGNNPLSNFSYTIPAEYVTDSFRMQLFWDANNIQECVYIDNIKVEVIETVCDDSVVFEVNGTQYYFDGDGDPAQGSGEITANTENRHFLENFTGAGDPNGFSYACNKDVTELVNFAGVTDGNGTYTVGGVDGDTGNEWSYAAWSLIIIYASPGADRHQLYLYDDRFIYSDENCNVDFDGDGEPGGIISGFLAPEDIMDAEHAARLTCFVGEGDDIYTGDRISVNGTFLDNTASPSTNVWNSASPGLAEDGIDIDTFIVEYPTIQPGDASAQVDLPTETDSWNLVYIILSFYSEVTSGGTISYLIRG